MEFIKELVARIFRIVSDVCGVIADHPYAFGIVATSLLAAVMLAAMYDEANRTIDGALEEIEEDDK